MLTVEAIEENLSLQIQEDDISLTMQIADSAPSGVVVSGAPGNVLQTNPDGLYVGAVQYVQTIDDLALIKADSLKDGQSAQVVSTGRAGLFRWQSGDLSAECAADPDRLVYVPSDDDPTGGSGAWVLIYDPGVPIDRTSLLQMALAASYCSGMYVRGDGSPDKFWVGYNINGKGCEFRLLEDPDGLFIVRGSQANDVNPGNPTRAENTVGTFNYSSAPNSYTSEVGATFDLPFTGSGLVFRSYMDNRGGVWRFTIDGSTVVDVSTWAEQGAVPALPTDQVVISGLTDGPHTCTAEFVGDDPEHPPTGGVSRGWLYYRPDNASQYTGFGMTTGVTAMVLSGAENIVAGSSILDFAINAAPNGEGVAGDWVPSHSSPGAARNISTKLLIDGRGAGSPASFPGLRVCDSVIVEHTYDAYSTHDTAGNFKLWTGVLTKKFDKNGLHIAHRIVVERDTFCAAGYFAPMLPVLTTSVDTAVYDTGWRKQLEEVASQIDSPVLGTPRTMAFINSATGSGVAYEVESVAAAVGTDEKQPSLMSVFLQQRVGAGGLAKSYWRRWEGEVIPAGSEHRVTARVYPIVGIDPGLF